MTNKTRDEKRCLALEFRPLVNGTGFGVEQQEEVHRFSSVELTGDFDPSCWREPCTDRATVLSNVVILSVKVRRSSSEGLWLGDQHPVREVAGTIANTIKKTALLAGFPSTPPMKVFATDDGSKRMAVCWSPDNFDGPGTWPRSLEGALHARSTKDFYRCNEVRRVGENFVLQVA